MKEILLMQPPELEWSNWKWAEPNGGRVENCATLTKDFMNDNSCEGGTFDMCTICDLPQAPELHLRGACNEENLDDRYSLLLNRLRSGRHDIRGWKT